MPIKSCPLNPILYFIYYCFKVLIEATRRAFYSKITVVNKERGRFKNPCIVVSNHPSTMLDPLNAAEEIQTEVYFLANASLFKNPIAGWILRKLYCIPIERHKDTGGKPLDNQASFEQAIGHLAKGGCLYIAPEGVSVVERSLRKLKTGTARIALATESRHHFQLGLSILPIGLNYSDPTKFRSHLLTILGEPIQVADFQQDWEQDEMEAVRKLTDYVSEKLASLLLNTSDPEEDKLLCYLEEMMQNENRLPSYPHFKRSQQVLSDLQKSKISNPDSFAKFREMAFNYFEQLNMLKTTDLAIKWRKEGKNHWPMFLLLTATLPFFLPGFLIHFVPIFASKTISRALNKDIDWAPTINFLVGFVVYPLLLLLEIWAVGRAVAVFGETGIWLKWLFILCIVPLGLAAEWWWQKWQLMRQKWRAEKVFQQNPAVWKLLNEMRADILSNISNIINSFPNAR